MKSFFDLTKDEGEILGPGTDLVISLVAVLIMLLALSSKSSQLTITELEEVINSNKGITQTLISKSKEIQRLKDSLRLMKERNNQLTEEDLILKRIRESQFKIIAQIALKYKAKIDTIGVNQFEIKIKNSLGLLESIKIKNDATLQRISFGSSTLFKTDSAKLKVEGRKILRNVASVFKNQLELIKEIQIQGHADADQISLRTKNDNMDLAGQRAISIVRFFRDNKALEIDPSEHVLYASSFGFYMPVERNYLDNNWTLDKIKEINKGSRGNQNRRIEIVINYRELYNAK